MNTKELELEKVKMTITIENLTKEKASSLNSMFEYMKYLGNIGSSRWVSFRADGDGNFRPKIKIKSSKNLFKNKLIDCIVKYDYEKKDLTKKIKSSEGDLIIDFNEI